jgi:hypothetical protein
MKQLGTLDPKDLNLAWTNGPKLANSGHKTQVVVQLHVAVACKPALLP